MTALNRDSKNSGFHIQLVEDDEGLTVLNLAGNLDADGAPVLSAELERHMRAGEVKLQLDFQDVDFISSAGVGSLIAGVGEFRDEGGDLQLINMSTDHRRVLEVLGLLEYVNL